MLHRHAAFGWSIALARGWTAELRKVTAFGETTRYLAIIPEAKDALLRLTPDDRGLTSAGQWVESVAQINRAIGRRVSLAQCGDFTGNSVEFVSADEWLRGWALCAENVQLDANYRCRLSDVGRDDQAVDEMLNSLRLEKSSG
jgi:hypothetical protein